MMIEQMMKDKSTQITEQLLEDICGDNYKYWQELTMSFTQQEIEIEWRFYKDGGWLAKVVRKKKTIFWGWVSHDGHMSASFNFANKPELRDAVDNMGLSSEIMDTIEVTPLGKTFGLQVGITNEGRLADLQKLMDFRKKV
ncbi:MAG: DUF3788 domain-containing protein [Defluviitaleaceae bacterium]|nr:DUF3788 domain-containing protein [Defluviitaleaceae bacterium]